MKPAAVLDIGSSKIVCLCGSFVRKEGITVHGVSVCPYEGYSDGEFLDHRSLHNAVASAVQTAEQESRIRIREIALAVPAAFCKLKLADASVPIGRRGKRVAPADIDEVISLSLEQARAPGYVLMHSTPVAFTVNGEVSAAVPEGVRTEELAALVSHMYVREDFVRSLEQALSPIDVEVSMCVCAQLCSAIAIIPEKERVRPAVLIDIGYRQTDVCLVENAALTATASFPVGGRHFASDLAFGLDVPIEAAETVKRRYVFMQEPLSRTEIVRLPSGPKRVDRAVIDLIMEARARELMTLIRQGLGHIGVMPEASPITYVTGGGFVMMKGGTDYMKHNLQLPVRRDMPWTEDMNTPNYTSAFAALDFVLRALGEEPEAELGSEPSVVGRLRDLFTK
ncbi:MAG: cell division FtsA domain-containing protein [Clostridia bacterium]|nr:cell division FtsA domain-containing protein [Clostridia bacterium]